MGSKLITSSLLKAHDYDGLAVKVAQVIAWIKAAR
jgi:hypothetical protein